MARRLRSQAAADVRADIARDPRVRHAEVSKSRPLRTFPPDDPLWKVSSPDQTVFTVGGAIVRLQPPASASDELVERFRASIIAAGALVVKVEPRAAGDAPVTQAAKEAPPEVSTVRQVVVDLVTDARSADKPALLAYVTEVLDEEGL